MAGQERDGDCEGGAYVTPSDATVYRLQQAEGTGSSTVEQPPHKGQEAGSTPARSTLGCGAGVAR